MDFNIKKTIGYLINRSAILIRQLVTKEFQKNNYNVTPEEWAILNMLWLEDQQPQSKIAESTFRDNSTLTRLIDKMIKKDFVKRENDEKDRRIVKTCLLPKGKKLKAQLIPCAQNILKRACHGISDYDLDITKKTLAKVINNLLENDNSEV